MRRSLLKVKPKYIAGAIAASGLMAFAPNRSPKPPIKIADKIVADTFSKQKPKNILVLDDFKEICVPIDIDLVPDVQHGFVVSRIIEKGLPNANVKKINIPKKEEFCKASSKKHALMGGVLKEIKNGKKYDAINISMGIPMPFNEFSKQTGIELTPENLASKARVVKDYLIKNSDKSLYNGKSDSVKIGSVVNFIDDLDSISSKGAKVYVAAGNSGKRSFNLLSLIDNSISVGALGPRGRKASYSADNSLVSRWKNDALKINKTGDGFNFSGGSDSDIGFEYTSNYFRLSGFPLHGTSFSAPKVLVEDLK